MRQYRIDNKDRKAYPLGLIHVDGGIHVSVTAEAKSCNFVLFGTSPEAEPVRIPFPEEGKVGNVWGMTLLGKGLERFEYAFEADGRLFSDPYGAAFTGQEEWGNPEQAHKLLHSPIREDEFD